MSMLSVRRSLLVAALFLITGCSSSISPASMPAQTKSLHSNALAPGASFVHAGVPFMPPVLRLPALPQIAHDYPVLNPLLFEGDSQNGQVEIFKQKGIATNSAPIATITDGILCPYGMVVDKIGRLYVANNCGRSTVTLYPKGKTIHSKTISNGISNPLGLAMDKHGTLYVSNYPAAITEYPYGTTSPSTTITGSGMIDPFGLALDSNGNLFVADFGASQVFEIPAGTTTVTPLNLQDLTEPLGVAIDKTTGNLWVTDGSGDKVNVYAPGSTTPSQTITAGYSFPYAITISSVGRTAASNLSSPIAVYAYKPGQFTSYATLTNDIAQPTGLLLATP